jgi:hypothetical protein
LWEHKRLEHRNVGKNVENQIESNVLNLYEFNHNQKVHDKNNHLAEQNHDQNHL